MKDNYEKLTNMYKGLSNIEFGGIILHWKTAKNLAERGLITLSEENKKKIKMYEELAEGMEYEEE